MAAVSSSQASPSWTQSVPVSQEPQQTQTPAVNHSRPKNGSIGRTPGLRNGGPVRSASRTDLTGSRSDTLQPPTNSLARKDSSKSGGNSSEPDSLLELYNHNSANRSRVDVLEQSEAGAVNGKSYVDDDDPENSRWIHRDKLARIESEELQRAGIRIGRDPRSSSRHAIKRETSRDKLRTQVSEGRDFVGDGSGDPVASPVPIDEDFQDYKEPMDFDLRRPEEIAADQYEERRLASQNSPARLLGHNPSYSRIPLPKSSPLPIPQDYIERDRPLPRRESGDDHSISYHKSRSRSQSVGSQVLLDDGDRPRLTTPTSPKVGNSLQSSPINSKGLSGATPTTTGGRANGRTTSGGQHKPRSKSIHNRDTPSQRPSTRSGEIKKPEGDPPWLATMYKPDPRLPPDQQLLPTVAKRLQQEQWEREGRPPISAGQDLFALDGRDGRDGQQSELAGTSPNTQTGALPELGRSDREWPLSGSRSIGNNGGATLGGVEHGGYKMMPTVQGKDGPPILPSHSAVIEGPTAEKTSKKKEKTGCACCVVM